MDRMTSTIARDLDFGLRHERETLDTIREYFGSGTRRQPHQFALYDYFNPETRTYGELKTRNGVSLNQYPDTVIGYNKVADADLSRGDHYLLFKFTDGIYGCKVDERLQSLPPRTFYRNNGEVKKNIHIPISWLKPLSNLLD